MHDDGTRAWLNRRRAAGLALAALLCWPGAALAAAGAHPVAIEVVAPGREGLELTARLTEDGGVITRNIAWTIRTAAGQTVLESEAGSADVSLAPGDYLVDAVYGGVSLSRRVSLPPGTRLMVGFVLKAGGLRIESGLGETDFAAVRPRVRVFALGGSAHGRLVASGPEAGAVLRLAEGRYRVESRAAAGNSAAVTDVEVKAGRVTTLAITHRAGLARLAFVGSPEAEVRWDVEDANGARIARRNGLNADLLLVPGTYTAMASVGSELLTATFRIAEGETRDIMLGN